MEQPLDSPARANGASECVDLRRKN